LKLPLLTIYLDNNVWDFLFARRIDLSVALPRDRFCLAITREAEFEIPAIPDDKVELKAFIEDSIARCGVRTDSFFGFLDESLPADQQRCAGFDIGRFASEDELEYMRRQRTPLGEPGPMRKTGLHKNEADRALALRSTHSVVLTLDAKKGPINTAYREGGKVVFLTGFDDSDCTLAQYVVRSALQQEPTVPLPLSGMNPV
jgi:hypothetical protein